MIYRRLTRMGVLRRRRPHWLLIGLLPAVPLVLVVNATAQDGSILIQTPNPLDVLYVISGDGANALALIGDEGVVLIDAMDAGSTPQMLEANPRRQRQARYDNHQHTRSRRSRGGQRQYSYRKADRGPRERQGRHETHADV